MASLHAPRELEQMVRRELAPVVGSGLFVQIIRDGDKWRASARFAKHGHSPDYELGLQQRVAEIGARLAKGHHLIG